MCCAAASLRLGCVLVTEWRPCCQMDPRSAVPKSTAQNLLIYQYCYQNPCGHDMIFDKSYLYLSIMSFPHGFWHSAWAICENIRHGLNGNSPRELRCRGRLRCCFWEAYSAAFALAHWIPNSPNLCLAAERKIRSKRTPPLGG